MSKTQMTFGASAQTDVMDVRAENVPWQISNMGNWGLTMSPSSGSASAAVDVSVPENNSDTVRVAFPVVSSTDSQYPVSYSLNVSQKAPEPYINIAAEGSVVFDGTSSSKKVKIESNYRLTYTPSADWLKAESTEDGVMITVTENTEPGDRSADLIITAGSLTRKLNVVQRAANVSSTIMELSIQNSASDKQIVIDAEASWTATASDSWIKMSPMSGTHGKTTVTVSVTDNMDAASRQGFIYINVGTTRRLEIAVKQEGSYISVSTKSVALDVEGTPQAFEITSNTSWKLKASESWIHLSKSSGSNGATVNVWADPNTAASRNGYIVVQNSDEATVETIIVTQESGAVSITAMPSSLAFGIEGGETKMYVVAAGNVSWALKTDQSWLTLDTSSGKGNGEINVMASQNNTASTRSANIFVLDEKGTKVQTIPVKQTTMAMSMEITKQRFVAEGDRAVLTVMSKVAWKLAASDWITLSTYSGSGDAEVTVTPQTNTTHSTRSGSIVLRMTDGTTVASIDVEQDASTAVDEFTWTIGNSFPSAGGSIKLSPKEAEAWSAQIVDGASWMSIDRTSDSSSTDFTVTAADNPSGLSRTGKIQVTYGYHLYNLSIVQEGKTIALSTNTLQFFAKGGDSGSVIVTDDKEPKVETSASWIQVQKNGKAFTVTADKNTSSSQRETTVKVSLSGVSDLSPAILKVTQAGVGGSFSLGDFGSDENWN